jgi:enoyl-CoA hydratase
MSDEVSLNDHDKRTILTERRGTTLLVTINREALTMGLANRLTRPGETLATALALADDLARFPQRGLRSDRLSVYEQWSLSWVEALGNETRRGLEVLRSGESVEGARRFATGRGRHGSVSDI